MRQSHEAVANVEQDDVARVIARLTSPAREALRNAEGIRLASGQPRIHIEFLVQGLHDRRSGPLYRATRSARLAGPALTKLLAKAGGHSLPTKYTPADVPTLPLLSSHVVEALAAAGALASDEPCSLVHMRHVVRGVLSIQDCAVVLELRSLGLGELAERETESDRAASLKQGTRGEQVEELQARLDELGLYSGARDGNFGPETVKAVLAFQGSAGLSADGRVGPQTWKALDRALAERQPRTDEGQALLQAESPVPEAARTAPERLAPRTSGAPDDASRVLSPYRLAAGELERHVHKALAFAAGDSGVPIDATRALEGALRVRASSAAFTRLRKSLSEVGAQLPGLAAASPRQGGVYELSPGLGAALAIARRAMPGRERLWGRDLVTAILFGPEPLRPAFAATLSTEWRARLQQQWRAFLEKDEPDSVEAWHSAIGKMQALPAQPSPEPALGTEAAAAWVSPRLGSEVAAIDPDRVSPAAADHLGVENEAFAFARVAASHETKMPLAIGVFGEWGSGKTFFMEKMRARVDLLQARAGKARRDREPTAYHTDIVQIQFNAWHYMETNLWASLIDHIFGELDKWLRRRRTPASKLEALYERLSTSRTLRLDAVEDLIRARRRREEAHAEVEEARRRLAEEVVKQRSITTQAFWDAVVKTMGDTVEAEREKLQRSAEALGFVAAGESAKGLVDALKQAGDEALRARLIARSVTARLAQPKWSVALVGLVALLPALAPLTVDRILNLLNDPELTDALSAAAVSITTTLATVTGWVGIAAAAGRNAAGRLAAFQVKLDRAIEKRAADAEHDPDLAVSQDVLRAERVVARRQQEVALAESALEAVSEDLEKARADFGETAAVRLNRFIRDKIVNGDYARHLGIIASVRKDFEELAGIMSDAESEGEAHQRLQRETEAYRARLKALQAQEGFQLLTADEKHRIEAEAAGATDSSDLRFFQRIILYIDDLDRCPPKTVVDVLQACHLLLTFPLFLVVVAVDARWVSRALLEQYKGLLHFDGESGGDGGRRTDEVSAGPVKDSQISASPRDYLEKIFQVPYWVRHMPPKASQSFTRDLVGVAWEHVGTLDERSERGRDAASGTGGERAEEPATGEPGRAAAAARAGVERQVIASPPEEAPASGLAAAGTAVGDAPAGDEGRAAVGSGPHREGEESKKEEGFDGEDVEANPTSLLLTPHERDALVRAAPFAGDSPRSVKRFVNVYRLLRTGLGEDDLRTLVGEKGESRDYQAIIAQLAIVTGAPTLADEYFDLLGPEGQTDGATLSSLRTRLGKNENLTTTREWPRLSGVLNDLEKIDGTSAMVDALRRRASVVKRYSFSARPYL